MRNLLFYFIAPLFLLSCAKDLDNFKSPDQVVTRGEAESSCEVFHSYSIDESTSVIPNLKPLEEFCEVDLLSIGSSSELQKKITICYNERGGSCLTIENIIPDRNQSIKNEGIHTMSFCDGEASLTTFSGVTETSQAELDQEIFIEFVKGIVYTQEEKDSSILVLINEAVAEGATVETDENYVIISQVDTDGNITKTTIDKVNNIILYTETLDKDGNLISKSVFKYTCADDHIVPDLIVTIDVNKTKVCDDKYIKKKVEKFSNHEISVR